MHLVASTAHSEERQSNICPKQSAADTDVKWFASIRLWTRALDKLTFWPDDGARWKVWERNPHQ